MSLADLDKPFVNALRQQAKAMKKSSESISAAGFPEMGGIEVTIAVLERLRAYVGMQNEIKVLLNKRYASPAADFFVETILFYLSLFCRAIDKNLAVHSERQIRPKRGQMRPDISVWHKGEVIAIVECKTQLGWNRGNWEQDFLERERRLKAEFPRARAFLLVMTEGNWGGFSKGAPKTGKQYFALLRKGVNWDDFTEDNVREKIVNRIEDLFVEVAKGH